MAAHITAVVAGPSQAAYAQPNYETFTPALPRLHRKRKEPSLSSAASVYAPSARAASDGSQEVTDSSTSLSSEPEAPVPVGCWGGLKAWIKSLF